MEGMLSTVDSKILDSFTFRLPKTASWALNKDTRRWYTSSNHVSPSGVRVARFDLQSSAGNEFLMPDSVIVNFDLCCDDQTNAIHLNNTVNNLFQRVIVRMNGTTISDESHLQRTSHMLYSLIPSEKLTNLTLLHGTRGETIPAGTKKTYAVILLAPIFQQPKAIPLMASNLTIDIELISSVKDPQLSDADAGGTTSNAFHLENISLQGDLLQINSVHVMCEKVLRH